MTDKDIEAAARAAHEVNRTYCAALGDHSQVPWEEAAEWQRESARKGVAGVQAGNTPRQSHESWLAEKRATGWKYGLVKNVDSREHPCMVEYDELPAAQQVKDTLFVATVRGVLLAAKDRDMAEVLAAKAAEMHAPPPNGERP